MDTLSWEGTLLKLLKLKIQEVILSEKGVV